MSLGKLTKEDQHFFLNSGEVFGVQRVEGGYNNPVTELRFLGMDEGVFIPDGPRQGSIAVSQFLITNDTFLPFTGQESFSGYLVRSKTDFSKNFSFTSGYMTDYAVRCGVGTIPEITVQIESYGKIGNVPISEVPSDILNASEEVDLKIADPGSISINIDEFNTNRVSSFEMTASCPRLPIYQVGSFDPVEVKSLYPFPVTLGFQIEVDDYDMGESSDYPCSKETRDISVTVKDFTSKSDIITYSFKNMTKVTQTVLSETNGNVSMSIQYNGFINK
tara:strand:+ start:3340 stop:4167 length:828 start_codon:yes stop_codon:yes gene_type:complete